MNGRSFSFGGSGNPLVQALTLVVLALVLVGAVILGAFILAAILGLGVIAFVGFKLRAWWLRRGPPSGGSGPGRPAQDLPYIEGQYEVIDTDAERRRSGERR
jgi:hypothetical protein